MHVFGKNIDAFSVPLLINMFYKIIAQTKHKMIVIVIVLIVLRVVIAVIIIHTNKKNSA